MSLQKISQEIGTNYVSSVTKNGGEGYSFDPATIMIIASIVIEVIQIIKECRKKKEEALKILNKPSPFERLILRRCCVKNVGQREFRKSGDKLMEALLNRGSTLTLDEVNDLYEEEEKDD